MIRDLISTWHSRLPLDGIRDRLHSGAARVGEFFSPGGRKRRSSSPEHDDLDSPGDLDRTLGKRSRRRSLDSVDAMPPASRIPERQTSSAVGMAIGPVFGDATASSPLIPRGLDAAGAFSSPISSPRAVGPGYAPSGVMGGVGAGSGRPPAGNRAAYASPYAGGEGWAHAGGSTPASTGVGGGALHQASPAPPPSTGSRLRIHGATMGSPRFAGQAAAPYANGSISTGKKPSPPPPGDDYDPYYAERYAQAYSDGVRDGMMIREQQMGSPPPGGGSGFKAPVDLDVDKFRDVAGGKALDFGAAGSGGGAGASPSAAATPAPRGGGAGGGVSSPIVVEDTPSAHMREVAERDAAERDASAEFDTVMARALELLRNVSASADGAKAAYQSLEARELEARTAAISAAREPLKERVEEAVADEEAGSEGSLESVPLGEADEIGEEWAEDPALRPLTEEQEDLADRVLSTSGSDGEQLVDDEVTGIVITRGDMRMLLPGEWLNDEVVNLYMGLLQRRNTRRMAEMGESRMHFFATFFYTKLTQDPGPPNHKAVRRWTTVKKLGGYTLMECAKIFCPINHHNTHWTQAVINLRDKRFEFYDSMAGGGAGVTVLKNLQQYIQDEWLDKAKETLDTSDWPHVIYPADEIPQQRNCFDCGVFSSKFADYLSRDAPPTFSQNDMPYFRRRIAVEIAALRAD